MNKQDLTELSKKIENLSPEEKHLRDIYLKKLADGTLQGPPVGYSSIDKEWLQFYDVENMEYMIPKKSMFEYFRDCVSDKLDTIAVDLRMSIVNNFKTSIKKVTYRKVLEDCVTIACGLIDYGMKPNEILFDMLPNLIEGREVIYAGNAAGATVYPVSPMAPPVNVDTLLRDERTKNAIIFSDFYKKFQSQLSNSSLERIFYLNGTESFNPLLRFMAKLKDKEGKFDLPDDKRIIPWEELIKAGKRYRKKHGIRTFNDFSPYYDENHIAVIIGTSGTTGIPKGACLSDKAVNAVDFSEELPGPFKPGETNFDLTIQSLSFGLGIMHHTMCGGLYNIITPELITDKIPEILAQIKPDNFSGGPVHYDHIARSKEFENGELLVGKNYISGGATLDKIIEKKLNQVDRDDYTEPRIGNKVIKSSIFVRQGLGSTENAGTGVYTTKGSYKFGSVGIPIALSNCAIFKVGTDEEVPTGTIGEICLRGDTMMNEYYKNDKETAKVLLTHSDGTKWLHLGDEGYMDKDGHVFITDRYKQIFMRNCFNVHPNKLRDVLLRCDDIIDCCVAGVEHPHEMFVPVVFLVLKDENADKEAVKDKLNKLCFDNLEEYYMPYEYVFVKELPRNMGGKIMLNKLVEDNHIAYTEDSEIKMKLR